VRRGATEELVAKIADYEHADLPERTKAALRYVDRLTAEAGPIDRAFYDDLRRALTDDELLDLGMVAMFFNGWQRLIDAVGIVPDRWRDGDPLPFGPLRGAEDEVSDADRA
jgi:alkylhydroperoxidase family enzyme